MHLKNLMSAATALLLALPVLARAEESATLEDLLKGLREQQSAAINGYIAAHPDAGDLGDALAELAATYMRSGDNTGARDALLKRYAMLAEHQDDLDMDDMFNNVVVPLVTLFTELGDKQGGKDFIARVGKDFENHEMKEQISQFLKGIAGPLDMPAAGDTMEIEFTALDGRKVNLAEMKDKVVLVDFWATWCGPCRMEMPNVIDTYAKYNEKGFEVIGISLDDDQEKLEKYIQGNKIVWPQYFDGQGWQNKLAARFGIQGIPATFLIGKDGKIAAADVRGEDLQAKVAELLAD